MGLHVVLLVLLGLWWSQPARAVPPDTVISNTASISFSVNGLPGVPLSSNTEQFTVSSPGDMNRATMNVGPFSCRLYAATTHSTTLDLINTGSNTLTSHRLRITVPRESRIEVSGSGITLLATTAGTTTTESLFSLPDLAPTHSQNLQLALTLPGPVDSGNNQLTIEHLANDTTINTKAITLEVLNRTKSTLEILQYSHSAKALPVIINPTLYQDASGEFLPLTAPHLPDAPGVAVTDAPVSLEVSEQFSHRQTLFLRVVDPDHNLDRTLQESVLVHLEITDCGECETLQLQESGVDTGVFTGYAILAKDTSLSHNGHLDVHPHATVAIRYQDELNGNGVNAISVLIDPYGEIFDSSTGQSLEGFTVRMINSDTGLPATVYGDDGVSSYPAAMVTGAAVTDSSGQLYSYQAGEYRFPQAPPGNYKLVVTVPPGAKYAWPSGKPDELLTKLPIDQLLITLGSRGETFPLGLGPPFHIDIPVDPLTTQLYVQRSANRESVAAGDFIRYSVSLENTTLVPLNTVVLTETLPPGFRLQKESVVVNGVRVADPAIAAEGSTLTFPFDTLAAGEIRRIEYLAAVGAVKEGIATSRSHAIANAGAAESNSAEHHAKVFDELMRDRALLLGQVILDGSDQAADEEGDLAGIRIYMEDGRYALTDQRGMFHFDNVVPGSHVVQFDLDTLPAEYDVVPTEKNTRFAGRAWSKFVDVQGGTLWRTDFHIARKPTPTGSLSLQLTSQALAKNGDLTCQVDLAASTVAVSNLRLTVMLPEQTAYRPGSSRLDGEAFADPAMVNGNVLTWRLGDAGEGWHKGLHFTLSGAGRSGAAELITKAYILFDTPAKANQRLPVASHRLQLAGGGSQEPEQEEFVISSKYRLGSVALSSEDKAALDRFAERVRGLRNIRIHAVGHTDNAPLQRRETIMAFGDNYRLAKARAQEVAEHLRQRLRLSAERVVVEGKGPDQPVASNDTEQGRAANRRVHLYVSGDPVGEKNQAPAAGAEGTSDKQSMVVEGPRPGGVKATAAAVSQKREAPAYDAAWLATQNAEVAWLLPTAAEVPAIPSATITIKHHLEHTVRLTQNGQAVPEVNFNGTIKNNKGLALSTWKGVDLVEGDNLFQAAVTDKEGRAVTEISRNLHFSGPPVRAEIVPDRSTLIADGTTPPVVAIRLYDKDDFPVHGGVDIEYTLNHPFLPARSSDLLTVNMPGAPGSRPLATVGDNGIALIKLEPSNESDDLVITLALAGNQAVAVKTRLKAQAREWILVGVGEGAAGYNTLSGNMEALAGDAAEDHLYLNDRIAFFAKGRILGKWLLTMAYDTDKERPKKDGHDPRLFQAIDPGSYYTIFGDAGQYGFGAPSTDKLYLKLERDEFYLLYGDYETGFKDTKLARYERTLTGIKSRYQDGKYNLLLFASKSDQSFVKDEFRGQGGSSLYRLSKSDVAMNTEKVILEVRDRFRSEVIVSSRELTRHLDYDINYRDGTLTFREPVFSTDPELNPQFIIVKYEAYGGSGNSITSGGRAEVKVNDKVQVGVTQVSEGRSGGEAVLGAADVQYRLSGNLTLRLEAAHSYGREDAASTVDGNARLVEVEHRTLRSSSKFYYYDIDPRFGLGQTNGSEIGMRKGGVETIWRATDTLNVKGQAYHLENRASNATRNLAEALGERTFGNTKVRAGLREVQDELGDGSEQRSDQVTTGISRNFFNNKLLLRADHEFNLNNGNDSVDFPDRTRLGADYHLTQNTALFVEQELTNGEVPYSRRSRMGVKATPWNGGEVYSGITRAGSNMGGVTNLNLAGRQKWQLDQAWSVDVGAEESMPLSQDLVTPFNSQTPVSPFSLTSGLANSDLEEFTAGSLGLTYSQEKWLWATRIEARHGESEDRRYLASSVQTSPQTDLSVLAAFSFTQSERGRTGEKQQVPDLVLGLAYRPREDRRWLLLDKLELKTENMSSLDTSAESWRIINLFNANYKNGRWQTSFQYGAKTVHETINAVSFDQFVDLTGIEARYDITEQWDIGLHGSILHAWDLNHYDFGSGISIGYLMVRNCWVSLGYNFTGFRDEDFSRNNYTSKGVFLKFLIKFDQQSVREGIEWLKN